MIRFPIYGKIKLMFQTTNQWKYHKKKTCEQWPQHPHCHHSIESWEGFLSWDSLFLDYCNPQYIKGSMIRNNHQPTGVLNTARVKNYIQYSANSWTITASRLEHHASHGNIPYGKPPSKTPADLPSRHHHIPVIQASIDVVINPLFTFQIVSCSYLPLCAHKSSWHSINND